MTNWQGYDRHIDRVMATAEGADTLAELIAKGEAMKEAFFTGDDNREAIACIEWDAAVEAARSAPAAAPRAGDHYDTWLQATEGLGKYVQHLGMCKGYDYERSSACECGAAHAIARFRRMRAAAAREATRGEG